MTWTYKLTDSSDLEVYDHNDTLISTVENDGSGVRIPDDVEEVMVKDAQGARMAGDMMRWREIHIRLAAGQVEERE